MRTLVHLSDLDFGQADTRLIEPLRRRVHALLPDVVVVCGNLTQRATLRQLREARAFLDTLPFPQVVVPGDNDVPRYNVVRRWLAPLAGYRRIVARDLEPSFTDDEIAVLGVNTARGPGFANGRIDAARLARIREGGARVDGRPATRIVACHHPFEPADADVMLSGPVRGDPMAPDAMAQCLRIAAGAATSTRERDEANAFNSLRIAPARIEVERYAWSPATGGFEIASRRAFHRGEHGWSAA
jgi:hypothetical protein